MPLSKTRLDRYVSFNQYTNSFNENIDRARRIYFRYRDAKERKFWTAVGGQMGGDDKRIIDCGYHLNPLEIVKVFNGFGNPSSQVATIENGGILNYERGDDGYVTILLYPPRTDRFIAADECYIFRGRITPFNALNPRSIRLAYNIFEAIHEYCSIDGNPTRMEKIRFWRIYYFKRKINKGVLENSRFEKTSMEILKLVITVGLSGFLLSFIECMFSK